MIQCILWNMLFQQQDTKIDTLSYSQLRWKLRTDFSDGDLDKENRFHMLTMTKMPAILTENFFMDNFEEFKNILNDFNGRQQIIKYHVQAIIKVKQQIFTA